MFVPDGYASIGDAVGFVVRAREAKAAATLTPDAMAFFEQESAALRPKAAPLAPIRPARLGPSPAPPRDFTPPAATLADLTAKYSAAQIERWREARRTLIAAKDKARADLRRALISGTLNAAAVRTDGNLITMRPADWRRLFTLADAPSGAYRREPFAEALEGRAVPLGATPHGAPAGWGHPIIARADLARWCSAPPEPEPAERPADWPALAPPANPVPTASPWLAAPPDWVTLDALPQAVASLTQAPADAAAAVLRPLLEAGALPWRWRRGAEPRGMRVTEGGALYGPVDANGRPLGPDWPALFSPSGAEARRSIEVGAPAAIAAVRHALPQANDGGAPEPAGQPAPVYSTTALRAWYRLRFSTWPASHPPPSEADDIAAASAHFRRDIPRDPFRKIRRELAPEPWKKPGPRRKRV